MLQQVSAMPTGAARHRAGTATVPGTHSLLIPAFLTELAFNRIKQ